MLSLVGARGLRRAIVVLGVALVFGVAGDAHAATPTRCAFESPCVYMTPAIDPAHVARGTEVTFTGLGWAPNSQVEAGYGSYCAPHENCAGVGLSTDLHADADGRFVLVFRYDTHDPVGVSGPVASGSEEVVFGGEAPDGRRVSRHPAPVPPPSTAAQRRQAAGMARAARQLAQAIAHNLPQTNRAAKAYNRQVHLCQRQIRRARGRRAEAVVQHLFGAALEAATYGVDHAAFTTFARRLKALRLTDPVLAVGARVWERAIARPRYVPRPSLCAVLRPWAAHGYRRVDEPIGPHARSLERDVRGAKAVRAAAHRLRDLGVAYDDTVLFAGDVLGLERYVIP
jgi:hypothetical protein